MEIEIKVINQTEITKKISLPCFRKRSASIFKVISQDHCIGVTHIGGHYSIGMLHAGIAFSNDAQEATEDEFNEEYHRIQGILNQLT